MSLHLWHKTITKKHIFNIVLHNANISTRPVSKVIVYPSVQLLRNGSDNSETTTNNNNNNTDKNDTTKNAIHILKQFVRPASGDRSDWRTKPEYY